METVLHSFDCRAVEERGEKEKPDRSKVCFFILVTKATVVPLQELYHVQDTSTYVLSTSLGMHDET